MQLMLATCNTHLLPFWSNHPPALPNHTSTSSSPMAGKAFAYSPDCQSRIIANCSSKASLSKSAIIKTVPGQLGWIGTIGITFLGRFQLQGDIYGQGGCVKLTDGKIKHAAIKRTMGGRIDQTTTNQKSAMMCVLRVGAVGPGETPPSNTAINREEDEPPQINKQMRWEKLNLAVDLTIKLHLFDDPRMEDLSAVSDWVLMINTTPAATKITVGAKRMCR